MIDTASVWWYIYGVVFAVIGGMARLLNKKDQSQMTTFIISSELFVSGFIGLMVMLFASAVLKISGDWVGFLSGMSGWIGVEVLHKLEEKAKESIGIDNKKTGG